MELNSQLIETAVSEISKLPSIGKKTAFRLVLHILKQDQEDVNDLANALLNLREGIQYCTECGNVADDTTCQICSNTTRDQKMICVVENFKDIFAIENTAQYKGLYHVLNGLVNPVEGVAPSDLFIDKLIQRVQALDVKEVMFALNPTMEGDTTAFYLTKRLKDFDIKLSTLARGVPIGGDLEYTDEITLGRSIQSRINYE